MLPEEELIKMVACALDEFDTTRGEYWDRRQAVTCEQDDGDPEAFYVGIKAYGWLGSSQDLEPDPESEDYAVYQCWKWDDPKTPYAAEWIADYGTDTPLPLGIPAKADALLSQWIARWQQEAQQKRGG